MVDELKHIDTKLVFNNFSFGTWLQNLCILVLNNLKLVKQLLIIDTSHWLA